MVIDTRTGAADEVGKGLTERAPGRVDAQRRRSSRC